MKEIFPLVRGRLRAVALAVCVSGMLAGGNVRADGPPRAEFGSMHHTAWTSEDGLGAVFDLQQTSDGFLWLTTSRGVLRFDGVRFQTLTEVTHGVVQGADINALFVGRGGALWLTTRGAGLLRLENGRVSSNPDRRCSPATQFSGIVEDLDGTLWIGSSSGLYRVHGTGCELVAEERGVPRATPAALLVDRHGTVWVKARSGALLYLPRGEARFRLSQMVDGPSPYQDCLREAPDGGIWLSHAGDLREVVDEHGAPVAERGAKPDTEHRRDVAEFAVTPDGVLWRATPEGVGFSPWRSRADSRSFTPAQGLTSNGVWKIFVGREGGVWVGTNSGLDQFRTTPLVSVVLPNVKEHEFAVAAGDDGSVWVGNGDTPLTHVLRDGRMETFAQTHAVLCLRRDRTGAVWAGTGGDVPLWRVTGGRLEPFHYPKDTVEGLAALEMDRNGDPWILTWPGSMYRMVQGNWIRQNELVPRKPGTLGAMTTDQKGNLWMGFADKLVKWDGSRFERFTVPQGSAVSVSTMAARGDHIWMAGRGGVALFRNGMFYPTVWRDASLPGRVSGIVETGDGELWINTFSGVTHVGSEELARWIAHPATSLAAQQMDTLDGLPGFSAERVPEPSLVEGPDGMLWFATTRGVARLNPAAMRLNALHQPPHVFITSVMANDVALGTASGVRLPRHTDHMTIDYTAPGLAIPQRVHFRYKLEGVDADWQDAGTRRQAFYNNLGPGHFTFRVAASNGDGIWSETGAVLPIEIAPMIYQTMWFRVLVAAMVGLLVWFLSVVRMQRATEQLRARMTERIDERERIARELHDTLLQSFQALILYFQTAIDRIDAQDPVRVPLEDALRRSDLVMAEGRERVRNLRTTIRTPAAFADLLTANCEELRRVYPCEFEMVYEGTERELRDHVLEEVYQIGREALTNAFRHAGARRIEVRLDFQPQRLSLLVQDDGRGIPEEVLRAGGREGHWGLTGMMERAEKIGATLAVRSEAGMGTGIELRVGGSLIYRSRYRSAVRRWIRRREGARSDLVRPA